MSLQIKFQPDGEFETLTGRTCPAAPNAPAQNTEDPAGSIKAATSQPTSTYADDPSLARLVPTPESNSDLSRFIVSFIDQDGNQLSPNRIYKGEPGRVVIYDNPPEISGYKLVDDPRDLWPLHVFHHKFPEGAPSTQTQTFVYRETLPHRLLHGDLGVKLGRSLIMVAAIAYCAFLARFPQYTVWNLLTQQATTPLPTVETVDQADTQQHTLTIRYVDNQTDVQQYKLTIRYVDETGAAIAQDYRAFVAAGQTYHVTSPAIAGYVPLSTAIDGVMSDMDAEYAVTYQAVPDPASITSPLDDPYYQGNTPTLGGSNVESIPAY